MKILVGLHQQGNFLKISEGEHWQGYSSKSTSKLSPAGELLKKYLWENTGKGTPVKVLVGCHQQRNYLKIPVEEHWQGHSSESTGKLSAAGKLFKNTCGEHWQEHSSKSTGRLSAAGKLLKNNLWKNTGKGTPVKVLVGCQQQGNF